MKPMLNGYEVSQNFAHASELLKKLRLASSSYQGKKVNYLLRHFLLCPSARRAATVQANQKLKAHRRRHWKELFPIADRLNAWHGTDEEVTLHQKAKKSDPFNFRPVMDFGLENRSLQTLVSTALSATTFTDKNQFAGATKGRTRALQAAAQAIASGFNHVAELDLIDCFPSFNEKKLCEILRLPEEVIKNVLTAQNLKLKLGNIKLDQADLEQTSYSTQQAVFDPDDVDAAERSIFGDEIAEARRGLPQGSVASPIVAEILLSTIFPQISIKNGIVYSYFDNFLIFGTSGSATMSMVKALESALDAHPAGPLRSKVKQYLGPGESGEILGYVISNQNATCTFCPPQTKLDEFHAKFHELLNRCKACDVGSAVYLRRLNRLKAYVHGWTSAYSLWPGSGQLRKSHLGIVKGAFCK